MLTTIGILALDNRPVRALLFLVFDLPGVPGRAGDTPFNPEVQDVKLLTLVLTFVGLAHTQEGGTPADANPPAEQAC